MAVTQPLSLQKGLSRPCEGLSMTPLFDVLLLAFAFSLLGSRFIMAPGLSLSMQGIELPQLEHSAQGVPTVEVITVKGLDSIFYRGEHTTHTRLMQQLLAGELSDIEGGTLLMRLHRGAPVDTLYRMSEWARQAGYTQVQLAGTFTNEATPEHTWGLSVDRASLEGF
jgi:biopolymer transport protein ExbD